MQVVGSKRLFAPVPPFASADGGVRDSAQSGNAPRGVPATPPDDWLDRPGNTAPDRFCTAGRSIIDQQAGAASEHSLAHHGHDLRWLQPLGFEMPDASGAHPGWKT